MSWLQVPTTTWSNLFSLPRSRIPSATVRPCAGRTVCVAAQPESGRTAFVTDRDAHCGAEARIERVRIRTAKQTGATCQPGGEPTARCQHVLLGSLQGRNIANVARRGKVFSVRAFKFFFSRRTAEIPTSIGNQAGTRNPRRPSHNRRAVPATTDPAHTPPDHHDVPHRASHAAPGVRPCVTGIATPRSDRAPPHVAPDRARIPRPPTPRPQSSGSRPTRG